VDKGDGATWSRSVDTSEVSSWGAVEPTRTDITKQTDGLKFTAQETKRKTLELYEGVNLSGVVPDPVSGEVRFDRPPRPSTRDFRAFGLFVDGVGADAIYVTKLAPKATVTATEDSKWSDGDDPVSYGVTLTAQYDADAKTAMRFFFGGPGWKVDTGLSGTLGRLRVRFDELGRSGSDSMSTLARGAAPVLDQLAKVSPVLGRVRDGFTSSQAAASAFSGAVGTVGGQLRTIADATGRVGAGLGSMATLSESALSRTGSAIGRGLTAPIRGASTILAGYGITAGTVFTGAGVAAVGLGVKFAASQEQAQVAFTTMLGSARQAQQFVAQLQDFAAKTPFDLPSVTIGAQRLMAFGFAAKDVLPNNDVWLLDWRAADRGRHGWPKCGHPLPDRVT
jgi:hypothetical protein